ncbi:hypothetical protein AB0G85_37635 [Streptomyces sioyaensis]|uniref:hypothetical protein n=1 Tax=Streptomyces sioyaensis TaxID=67364 RepID=UPI0033F6C2E2
MRKLLGSLAVAAVLIPASLAAAGSANAATYEPQVGKVSYKTSPSSHLSADGDADFSKDDSVVGPAGATISRTQSSARGRHTGLLNGGLINLGALLG